MFDTGIKLIMVLFCYCRKAQSAWDINFSYFVIRFLLKRSVVKSDNEIGKVNDKKKYD